MQYKKNQEVGGMEDVCRRQQLTAAVGQVGEVKRRRAGKDWRKLIFYINKLHVMLILC